MLKFMACYAMLFLALNLGIDAASQTEQWKAILYGGAAGCWIGMAGLLAFKYEVTKK